MISPLAIFFINTNISENFFFKADIYRKNIMKKVIRLSESQLKGIIGKIIEEQQFQPGLNYDRQYSKSADPFKTAQSQKAVVKNLASSAVRGLKEAVITIGKVTFKIIITPGVILFLIAGKVYKVLASVGKTILKFISSTGKSIVSGTVDISKKTVETLKAMSVPIEQDAQAFGQWLSTKKDQTVGILKFVINSFKQFGDAVWGKLLIGASAIKEFSSVLGSWVKDSYNSVAKEVGLAWDQAVNAGRDVVKGIKQGANNITNDVRSAANYVGNKVSSTAANIGNSLASAAGSAAGYIRGWLNEMFERYFSMENYSTSQILSECVRYNGKVIL
jgi:hypothetical protein